MFGGNRSFQIMLERLKTFSLQQQDLTSGRHHAEHANCLMRLPFFQKVVTESDH